LQFEEIAAALIALLVVAKWTGERLRWPQSLLSLLHLTAATNDLCSGVCAGLERPSTFW